MKKDMIPAVIFTACILAFVTFLIKSQKKVKQISTKRLLVIKGAQSRYHKLPLGNYGVFSQVKDTKRVKIIFPRLNQAGNLEYIFSWHNFRDVDIVKSHQDIRSLQFQTAEKLAYYIQEHLKIEADIKQLNQELQKIDDLADLVSTSDIYSPMLDTYERAILQIENTIKKAQELETNYIRLIREALIGVQVAEYDPDMLPDNRIVIDMQCKKLNQEYQQLKNTIIAYSELIQAKNSASNRSKLTS